VSKRHDLSDRPGGPPDRWTTREDEIPDATDDGIVVGVPPVPEDRGLEDSGLEDGGPGDGGLESPVAEEILTDTVALASERDDYLLALQRLQADFENYKKRVQRQQEEQSARAATDLVGKLLPVLDTLDLAQAHREKSSDDDGHDAEALDQARAQLLEVLRKEGLERVDAPGVVFDPVVHDAVAAAPAPEGESEDDDGGSHETTIDEVLRAGYRWRGQVLRPAMVRVRG
jgi:molecular chaperone GrpE